MKTTQKARRKRNYKFNEPCSIEDLASQILIYDFILTATDSNLRKGHLFCTFQTFYIFYISLDFISS